MLETSEETTGTAVSELPPTRFVSLLSLSRAEGGAAPVFANDDFAAARRRSGDTNCAEWPDARSDLDDGSTTDEGVWTRDEERAEATDDESDREEEEDDDDDDDFGGSFKGDKGRNNYENNYADFMTSPRRQQKHSTSKNNGRAATFAPSLSQHLRALFASIQKSGLATCRASSLHRKGASVEAELRERTVETVSSLDLAQKFQSVVDEAIALEKRRKRGADVGWPNEVALARFKALDALKKRRALLGQRATSWSRQQHHRGGGFFFAPPAENNRQRMPPHAEENGDKAPFHSVVEDDYILMADLAASLRANGVKMDMAEVQELWDLLVSDCAEEGGQHARTTCSTAAASSFGGRPGSGFSSLSSSSSSSKGCDALRLTFAQFEAWLERWHPQLQGARRVFLSSFLTEDAFAREFKFHTVLVDRLLEARHLRKQHGGSGGAYLGGGAGGADGGWASQVTIFGLRFHFLDALCACAPAAFDGANHALNCKPACFGASPLLYSASGAPATSAVAASSFSSFSSSSSSKGTSFASSSSLRRARTTPAASAAFSWEDAFGLTSQPRDTAPSSFGFGATPSLFAPSWHN